MTTSVVISLLVIPMMFEIYDEYIKTFNIKLKDLKILFHKILKEAYHKKNSDTKMFIRESDLVVLVYIGLFRMTVVRAFISYLNPQFFSGDSNCENKEFNLCIDIFSNYIWIGEVLNDHY